MADLSKEIAFFESRQPLLESEHFGKWALIHGEILVGAYESFNDAAVEAVKQFGRGPYLIRQVGSSSITLPASAMFITQHARS